MNRLEYNNFLKSYPTFNCECTVCSELNLQNQITTKSLLICAGAIGEDFEDYKAKIKTPSPDLCAVIFEAYNLLDTALRRKESEVISIRSNYTGNGKQNHLNFLESHKPIEHGMRLIFNFVLDSGIQSQFMKHWFGPWFETERDYYESQKIEKPKILSFKPGFNFFE